MGANNREKGDRQGRWVAEPGRAARVLWYLGLAARCDAIRSCHAVGRRPGQRDRQRSGDEPTARLVRRLHTLVRLENGSMGLENEIIEQLEHVGSLGHRERPFGVPKEAGRMAAVFANGPCPPVAQGGARAQPRF